MPVSEFLRTLSRWRDHVLSWFLIFLVLIMVLTVIWQVFTRLVLRDPAVWTEESSTYMLMWCGLIGAAHAYGQHAHVGMEYFSQKLGPFSRTVLELVITLLVGYFAVRVMIMGGINYARVALINEQETPTLGIPAGYLNLCIPLSGVFFLSYCVEFFVRDTLRLARGPRRDATTLDKE
ncbi:MAG: TRAP transporter small permease [Pirellulaceae bacterium]